MTEQKPPCANCVYREIKRCDNPCKKCSETPIGFPAFKLNKKSVVFTTELFTFKREMPDCIEDEVMYND